MTVVKHRFVLNPLGAPPIISAPYRAGPEQRELEHEEVAQMKKAGITEPAVSDRASRIVFVHKLDGSFRFRVDYRRLNAVTVRESYPILRMDECIDSLVRAKLFSTLHANSGYRQIEMDKNDVEKTAFVSCNGLYKYIRMPFGSKNAPATF